MLVLMYLADAIGAAFVARFAIRGFKLASNPELPLLTRAGFYLVSNFALVITVVLLFQAYLILQ